ncbi:MAG: hypothetical protein J4N64_00605 [Chloroflexi bacterium]|nr:hypothetical protein [Chloroflexota bacterium]MCI0840241.1 hypothetical protein [Chloroflexota bacterium]
MIEMNIARRVERRTGLLRAWATSLALLFTLAATGCATTNLSGNALLPDGIEDAKVPRVESRGYLYFNPGVPVVVTGSLFNVSLPAEGLFDESGNSISLDHATLILGATTENVGASLNFVSAQDSQAALELVSDALDSGTVRGHRLDEQLFLATGDQQWREAVTGAYNSGDLVSVKEGFPTTWALLNHLPASPPSKPVMAGVLHLDANLLQSLMASVDVEAEGIGNAFGLVRVESMAFAVYTDDPLRMSTELNYERLVESGSGILLVSQSSYPGPIVSFMLGVMSERTDLELIELGTTNARYRRVEGLHLIIKNRGSLLFAAIATTRQDAEELMLSALFG